MQRPQLKTWQWIVLVLVFLVGLDWYIRSPDSRSRELTAIIQTQASSELRDYPYRFHVLRVEGETAVMATPRNFDVPAFNALGVLYPEINVKDANNPAFIAVEQQLGRVQDEARAIVLAQPGIKSVRWELDRVWLQRHYIQIPERH